MAEPVDIISITEALKGNLESLLVERSELKKREKEIELKISALYQSLSGLLLYADAMDQTDQKFAGLVKSIGELLLPSNSSGTLTEACRNVLRTSPKKGMSAMDVRKALETSNFDFSGYTSNPLSSIHTTLRRLKENEEAKEIVVEGTKFYKWIPKPVADPFSGVNIADIISRFNFPTTVDLQSAKAQAAMGDALKGISPNIADILAAINLKDKK